MSKPGSAPPPSIESLVVDALRDDDRNLLRQGAVLRYITSGLATVVTGSAQRGRQLVEHPVVQASGGRTDETWMISLPMRKALVSGWTAADADVLRARVAEKAADLEALYAKLSAGGTRAAALAELEAEFGRAIEAPDVPRAHDLLRLLDEWPVADAKEAKELHDRLSPRLRRHSRALRDREATESYLERGFEQEVWQRLLTDDQRWMLHLHGPGGRGKTMFVRNLLGRRCPQQDIPVARIDFDYVAQLGIATTQPWRLLLAIAAQLDPQLPDSPFRFMLDSYGEFQGVARPEAMPRVRPAGAADPSWQGDVMAEDAARDVPRNFRSHLATAIGDGRVVIALDTVENVLHTDAADLEPVLSAFDTIRDGPADGDAGDCSDDGCRVPGLRLIVSGRFDLAGDQARPGDLSQPRVPDFRKNWVGPDTRVERIPLPGTELQLGCEVATFEVTGFSPDEARRFLTEKCGLRDPRLVDAIVERLHDNPMKLAMLAEYVNLDSDITAETISSFTEIDMFYLVDRVVDRIADTHVQWLLRWGALLPIVTREAVELVIWPTLRDLATITDYDDIGKDGLPRSRHDVSRWEIPLLDSITEEGALDKAWARLLDYAAHSSWVSLAQDLPDAVVFHPEVREPLRRLLRLGGHPAYDDIHQRSFKHWSEVVSSTVGGARTTAMRALLYHAYQPWAGLDHDGDTLFGALLDQAALDRTARAGVAQEVLDLARSLDGAEADPAGPTDAEGPSAEARARAHLELAEAMIDTADQHGGPVAEGGLSFHLNHIGADLGAREPRRIAFLHAVLDESSGQVELGWTLLGVALDHPAPTPDPARAHLILMVNWAADRTPPSRVIDVARRLVAEATGTGFTGPAAEALARGLLAAERWTEALDAARQAGSVELQGTAMIGLGHADAVLAGPDYSPVWRARARLLRYEPEQALVELAAFGPSPISQPDVMLLRGRAYAQLNLVDEAMNSLSHAASSRDTGVSVEAGLQMAQFTARIGHVEISSSHLMRLTGFTDPTVVLRAQLLSARLTQPDSAALGEAQLAEAERQLPAAGWLPPSLGVELAITRLAVRGHAEERLRGLRDALAAIPGARPRLRTLGGLTDVPTPAARAAPPVADELRTLTRLDDTTPATLFLARAELERVLGDPVAAHALLDQVSAGRFAEKGAPNSALESAPKDALARAVTRARGRMSRPTGMGSADPGGPVMPQPDGAHEQVVLTISTDLDRSRIRVEPGSDPTGTLRGPAAVVPRAVPRATTYVGTYAFADSPDQLLDVLRQALLSGYAEHDPHHTDRRPLLLHITDENAARWPWELAWLDDPAHPVTDGVLRQASRLPRPAAESVASPAVLISILNERRDRGHVAELLSSFYGGRAEVVFGRSSGPDDPLAGAPPGAHVVHLVADPVQRNRLPALQLGYGDFLTAESLAKSLGNQPRLLILDLVLSESDVDAAEQLMIANAFCWHLARLAPDLDVLCGTFGGANDRIGSVAIIAEHLTAGDSLAELVDDLQRFRPPLPGGRHPLRDFVSLSSDHPNRRFRLGAPS